MPRSPKRQVLGAAAHFLGVHYGLASALIGTVRWPAPPPRLCPVVAESKGGWRVVCGEWCVVRSEERVLEYAGCMQELDSQREGRTCMS